MFEKFGEIESVFVKKVDSKKPEAPNRLLAFVCFKDPDTAAKAVEEMHEKEFDGQKLYVSEALKKQQLAKEIFKFKNAKKRCNLFVKGFPADTDEK
jgi:polyadenylate-binding protein